MDIRIDFAKEKGRIKPLHGVGSAPFFGMNFSKFHYLTEAGIPFSRLHDVGGMFGNSVFVDIPNLFRNFDADPFDPVSYDFAFTDRLITALVEAGVTPFFRLGVTIENYCAVRTYFINPPTDVHKWAVICEHIVRHYTEGWANGFFYDMPYWEIWNEPDNSDRVEDNQMWTGTAEQYYELYAAASCHLKAKFPHLKIGGYGSCGFYAINSHPAEWAKASPRTDYFISFMDGFLAYIKERGCPLDFFSWHSYDDIESTRQYARYARARLDEAGFTETETSCNEWNPSVDRRGTLYHAAQIAGMLLMFQDEPVDTAMFYDARFGVSIYAGMFNPLTGEPFPSYYGFVGFNRLYTLGRQVTCEGVTKGVYAVAARDDTRGCLMLVNTGAEAVPLSISAAGRVTACHLTSEKGNDRPIDLPTALPPESVLTVEFAL